MADPSHDVLALRARLARAGASEAELRNVANFESLVLLAADVGVRPKGNAITHAELAARCDVSIETLTGLRASVGLSPAVENSVCWFESDVKWVQLIAGAASLLGEATVIQLIRRAGWSMSQVAHASSEAFRVNVLSDPHSNDDAHLVSMIEHNLIAAELLDGYVDALGEFFGITREKRFVLRRERSGRKVNLLKSRLDSSTSPHLRNLGRELAPNNSRRWLLFSVMETQEHRGIGAVPWGRVTRRSEVHAE